MTKAVTVNHSVEQGIREFLTFLLDTGKVKGVFTLKKLNNGEDVAYSLITRSDELTDAVPFFPLMPVNAGKLISRFTMNGPPSEPVAVVLKPCELRAFIELVKLEQGALENMVFISATCGGVFPLNMVHEGTIEKNLSPYWTAIKKEEIPENIRPVCKACTEFIPYNADLVINLVGNKNLDSQCDIVIETKKGEEITTDTDIKKKYSQKEYKKENLDTFKERREAEKKKIIEDIDTKLTGMDGLIEIFGKCIGCHGCSKACPICYCKLCEFESSDSEYGPSNYEAELKRRGAVRVPPNTLYYHLGRLSHIAISCVGCGSCEDACPVDIPVSIIFKKIGESIQNMFEYTPGKSIEEKIPLTTFKEKELTEIEE